MTIQVGTPGNSGGTGSSVAADEIALAGGRVTVEADGSITVLPPSGELVRYGTAVDGGRRHYVFDGPFSGDGGGEIENVRMQGSITGLAGDTDGQYGLRVNHDFITQTATEDIDIISQVALGGPGVVDNLTGNILEMVTLDIEGPPSGGVANYSLLVRSGLSRLSQIHSDFVGPHSFGTSAILPGHQYEFSGLYSPPGSDPRKMIIQNDITGQVGAQNYDGLRIGHGFITQAADEVIATMYLLNVITPPITNNLTGAGTITNAAAVRIQGAPTAATNNFALLVEAGLSRVADLEHTGTALGFYGTAGAAQAAAYTRNATVVEDRILLASASATTLNNNNVLAALIADLQAYGLLQ